MKINLVLIALGGALGSVMRYLISVYASKAFYSSSFPYGTFAVNVTGCLLIGIAYALSVKFEWFTPSLRLFFVTGFCGGFTTFSAFSYENMQMLQQSNVVAFAVYTTTSFIICIAAVFAGWWLVRLI